MTGNQAPDDGPSSAGHSEPINLDDNGYNAINVLTDANDPNENDSAETSSAPTPAVSIRDLGENAVQNIVFPRPFGLWAIAILIIVMVFIDLAWIFSPHSITTRHIRAELEGSESFTFITVVIAITLFLQFLMGLLMIVFLCKFNDKMLIVYLRVYVVCCCILDGKALFLLFHPQTTQPLTNHHVEGFLRIAWIWTSSYVIALGALWIHDLLGRHKGGVSSQVSYEQSPPKRNFGSGLNLHEVHQLRVVLVEENQTGIELIDSAV